MTYVQECDKLVKLLMRDITNTSGHCSAQDQRCYSNLRKNCYGLIHGQKSFFSMQVQRFADLYTYDCVNLLSYPWFYHFRPQSTPMPHENDSDEPVFPR